MPIVLYHFPLSAPSRAAFLTVKALGIQCDVKQINLLEKEQLSEEFIKHPAIFAGETIVSDDKKKQLDDAFKFLDMFLDGNDYVCGNTLTIADISLVASVSSIKAVGWNCAKYKNIENWLKKCAENIPGYTENEKGAESFGNVVKSKLAPGQF